MDVKSSARKAAVAPRQGRKTGVRFGLSVVLIGLLLAAAGPAAAQICPEPQTTEPGTPGPGGPPSTPPGGPPDSPPGGPPDSPPGGPPGGEEPAPTACPPIDPPDGAITATPMVCTIPAGGSTCSSTISWWSQNLSNVQVKVFSHASGTTQLFAAGATGSQAAPWIDAAGVRFDLLSGSTVWDSVEVKGNRSPSVSLTAPASGAVFLAPAKIDLSASASDTDGTIAKVEFFNGTTKLGEDPTAPYSFTWSNVPAGSYSLTAKATDNLGAGTVSAAVPVTVSNATVKLTATNKQVASAVTAPATAAASFRLAQAGKIRFQTSVGGAWVEQTPLDEWLEPESGTLAANFEVLATPVSGTLSGGTVNQWLALSTALDWTLTRASVGSSQAVVNLQIRRIGTATVLATADVTLKATVINQLPSVTLTSPANGTVVNAPGSFTLTASASDPDGTIAKVEFFNGGVTLPGTPGNPNPDTTAPYGYLWNGVPAGTYTLTAVATDNLGATKTSTPVTVTVVAPVNQAPTATLTAPANGASFTAPANITLTATATDPDGTIAKVEFFKNNETTPFKTLLAAPYSFTWSDVPAGSYSLTAKATDNQGTPGTSPAITIQVLAPAPCFTLPPRPPGTP